MRVIETAHMSPPPAVDPGPAPMLDWLPLTKLVIDDDYQRTLGIGNWKAIRKIADNFSWSKFAPVLVAPIEGGVFAVIDGQHRAHAAQICGFERVPCQITQMNKAEQARAFAAVNGDVVKVTTWQVYRAAIMAGEDWAVAIRDCAEAAGCQVMTGNKPNTAKAAGEIYSIMAIGELIGSYGAEPVTACLKMIKAAKLFGSWPENWAYGVLIPVMKALLSRPYAMQRGKWVSRFLDDELDVLVLQEQAGRELRALRMRGATPPQKKDMFEALVGDQIDKALGDKAEAPPARIGGKHG
ncbi:hypothetical protein CXZ10_05955 [Pleomorphomonas diazotrophica]|uniref:ParB-like N-terminal domain-containing protein n=1 Tax=Pleomorphomonas diazotrophica TaxID=1166257 RepID=A0A1I4Q6Z9_9HYPH|nr:ParB N-terminal domain-containing protein [Pleomorphomonas diazotrophica]PKR90888.1 hypothetical protein CXZ10_05955 [Pleomorphomonas diazotrophica]SFM35861.1 ParB-like nuclease domain-containing protein [Pleomorphomonas diazotrophica]